MITLSEVKELLEDGDVPRILRGLFDIVEREEALTDTCPVCMGTGGYWTDEWQEDKYCSGLGLVTADRGYSA